MKLLVISNMYPSKNDMTYGTFVAAFVEQMRRLNRDGRTDLVVLRGANEDRRVVRKAWRYAKFYLSATFALLFRRYDLVYVHFITHSILPVKLVAAVRRLPLVLNVHGGDVLAQGAFAIWLKQRARSVVERDARLVVSPSLFFKDIILREFPRLAEERVVVSPSGGVDKSFFADDTATRSVHEPFTIGYVSRIAEGKGWDTLLQAAARLKADGVRFKLVVAGRGGQQEAFLKMVEELGLGGEVDYVGPMPHASLPDVYRRMDVFVFPTRLEESFGLVGVEAMAMRLPVMGSRIGGLTDYIRDGRNGFFFAPGNADELHQAIKRYMALPADEKERMSKNAYDTARQYEADEISRRLYATLVETFGCGGGCKGK